MKSIKLYSVFAILLITAFAGTACAAPNIFGISGLLEMPDDVVLSPGSVSLAYHGVVDAGPGDDDLNFFTVGVGITPGLEVSGGLVDANDTDLLLNVKYRIAAETADRPAFTVGVVDIAEEISDDPGFFLLISKTLTAAAEGITGEPSKPLRGHIGFGSGIYEGLLAGLNWALTPQLQLAAEYVGEGLEDGDFNVLARYAVTSDVRLDVGLIDFDDFTFGISYTSRRF